MGGLRTYAVLSLFGGIAGVLFAHDFVVMTYILLVSIVAITVAAYILDVGSRKAFGITTELAILITFLIGFMVTSNVVPIELVLVILILLTFFLAKRGQFGSVINIIKHRELIDIASFGVVALVILPMLPNVDYSVGQFLDYLTNGEMYSLGEDYLNISIVNPFKIWLIVVLISGVDLLGYMLVKFFGKKNGTIISGLIAGLLSSTTAVITYGEKDKRSGKKVDKSSVYAGVALIANGISFVSGLLLLGALADIDLVVKAIPIFGAMLVVGLITGGLMIFLSSKRKLRSQPIVSDYKPFSVVPAVKFVLIILILKLIIQVIQVLNAGDAFVVLSSLSGIVGMDAPIAAVSELTGEGRMVLDTALISLMLANIVNFVTKSVYAFFAGSRNYWKKYTIGLGITLMAGLLVMALYV